MGAVIKETSAPALEIEYVEVSCITPSTDATTSPTCSITAGTAKTVSEPVLE